MARLAILSGVLMTGIFVGHGMYGGAFVLLMLHALSVIHNKLGLRCVQSGIYCEATGVVIVNCKAIQKWNWIPVLNAALCIGSVISVIAAVICKSAMNSKFGILFPVLCLGPLLLYVYRTRSADKNFRKALSDGTVELDGVHFTMHFLSVKPQKKPTPRLNSHTDRAY